jgi:hypothetical protein
MISYSRFYGLDHGVPCPELLFLFPAHCGWSLFTLLPSTVIPSVDELLFKFDGNFGHVEMYIGRLLAFYPLRHFFGLVYWGIPAAGVLVYLALPDSNLRRKYVLVNLLTVLLFVCYRICPASGPSALIGDLFPYTIPNLISPRAKIIPGVLFNSMPSGHFTWAILMFWFGKYCKPSIKTGSTLFLFFTFLATLGRGEHYLIDLIVAVPFSFGIWSLAERKWRRASLALVLVTLWCVCLREGWLLSASWPVIWVLGVLTVAVAVARELSTEELSHPYVVIAVAAARGAGVLLSDPDTRVVGRID